MYVDLLLEELKVI